MIRMQGKGVSKGVAVGRIQFFVRRSAAVEGQRGRDAQTERERFARAQAQTAERMEQTARQCREDGAAELFEAYAQLAQDEDFAASVLERIEKEGCSAEFAVRAAGEQFAAMLSEMDDAYMQARAADVRDVARQLIAGLTGSAPEGPVLTEPVILAADDLSPSETVRLDRSMLLGFVTQGGSVNGHTAILARTMSIPAVCGLGEALREEMDGRTVCIDGGTGQVTVDPDEDTLKRMTQAAETEGEERRRLDAVRGLPDETQDGRRLDICCNAGSLEDVDAAVRNDGRGIGLFRSEFLYLARTDFPTEDEQFRVYRAAAERMQGRRVVIRTLDAGADKQAEYFGLKKEENPALGVRAVRFCLNRPEVFLTQLRAIYRASAFGRIAMLFPMIASVWEVRECRRLCREAMAQLKAEGAAFNPQTEVGVMIETPASVMMADELAREADFFSVGTNDLTQYMLACDRQSGELERYCDPKHPAVLRAMKQAADAAHRAGIWIGVCGELAADRTMLPAFLAMGVDELSVPPADVLPLRAEIRKMKAESCTLNGTL